MAEFNLTEEAIDDILYFARALELQSLKAAVEECARSIDKMPRHVLAAAVDESSRCTALHMAAGNGHTEVLRYIVSTWVPDQNATSTAMDSNGTGHPRLDQFVNATNERGNTALHWAAVNGHLEAVKVLVDAGADMLLKNKDGHNPTFEAERAHRDEVAAYMMTRIIADGHETSNGTSEERDEETIEVASSRRTGRT